MTQSIFRAPNVRVSSFFAIVLAACGGTPTPPATDAGNDAAVVTSDAGHDAAVVVVDAGHDAAVARAPIFRNEVDMADDALAREALRLMGSPEAGGVNSCNTCHGITRESIAHMRMISDTAWSRCFGDLEVATPGAAETTVACFREGTDFTATNLGVFASGGWAPWFRFVFERTGRSTWEDDYDDFTMRAAMPPEGHIRFTQAEFDVVTEWFLRGTPGVNDILPPSDVPGTCTPYVGDEIETIVETSAVDGWSARNRSAGILMHGCAGTSRPEDCLSEYPLASSTTVGADWDVVPGTQTRILFEVPYRTSYWTRSSADGRFVAHGGGSGGGASIIDLQRDFVIPADASFDPGFFPDNSGFLFQGGGARGAVCAQSVLTSAPTSITFREAGCISTGIPLYEHLGASLEGGDYWVVTSSWVGDPGGSRTDPEVFFDASSRVTLHALVNTGSSFTSSGTTVITTPNEGSAVLGQSARTVITQIGDASGTPIGYVVRRLSIVRDGAGGRTITLPEIGRYCVPGGKPATSLDDRWLVTHHRATDADAVELGFTGPTDPAFAPYRGVSNVYLIDMLTGVSTRVTHMAPGQQALFPHFRSDGWLYYLVRTGSVPEYVVATDAAIVLAD